MTSPVRIQRKRTKGWRMPDGAVYVGRPTAWRNPFRVGGYFMMGDQDPRRGGIFRFTWCESFLGSEGGRFTLIETPEQAVEWFQRLAATGYFMSEELSALRGKDLACWCPLDQPCHADILLELANR